MSVLYVTEQNAWIKKTSDRLVIEKEGAVLQEVSCLKLETVLLFGNVQVTTQALAELLEHGIEVALFSAAGRLRGQLTPPKARNVVLRMHQYELSKNASFRLAMARSVVEAKVGNALAFLRQYRKNHPDRLSVAELAPLEEALGRVPAAASAESLRGIEGAAAAAYFRLLGGLVPAELGFAGRERRPPPDPFNALLSFGYVLVGNELQSLLDGMGFDPYLGFFHELDYGRPSLALDLLEELRAPLVDRFSLKLVNLGILAARDFSGDRERGVLLSPEARKRYFRAYEEEMTTAFRVDGESVSFRGVMRRQAERLARALAGEEVYRPFEVPC